MGLLDAYQDSTDKAVEVMLSRPVEPDPVKPKHSVWSTIPRALGAAGAEVVGNVSDVLDAFGQTAAAAGGMGAGIRPTDEKRGEQSAEAFRKLKVEGIDWRSDDSKQAYTFARDLRPDPATAGTAENIVFGLTKGLAKAVGSAMTMGPIPGALGFGLSEGMTASEDLAEQGVDPATRFKVGAVTAAMNTAGVALPVAGKSLAGTAALVVAGGPGSFVAQQMATRSILENADYGALAAQYDPLDPVGLIVSTLVPAGFAAYAKRGGFAPRPAADVGGQPAPDAAPDVAPAAPKMALTQDDIDAVMVQNLTEGRDAHEATDPAAFVKALEEADAPAALPSITEKDGGWIQAESEFGRVGGTIRDGTLRITFAEVAEAERGKGYGVALYQRLIDEATSRGLRVTSDVTVEGPAVRVYEALARRGYQVSKTDGAGVIEPDEAAPNGGLYGPDDTPVFSVTGRSDIDTPAAPKPAATEAAEVDAFRARVDDLIANQPDMVARIDESGEPVRLADELAAIRKAAEEGTDTEFGTLDAPLLKVAAECALSIGTAAI